MNEGKEPRPGMACDGWAACDRPSCYICWDKREGSCKSCWEKTLDAFRTEGGLNALMKALGRVCYSCANFNLAAGVCADTSQCVGDDDFCSFWAPFEACPETEGEDDPQ